MTRLAADRLAHPGDLPPAVSMDDLRDEHGALSTERTIAAIDAVPADRPHSAKPDDTPASRRMPNLHNGAWKAAREPAKLSFGTALTNARIELRRWFGRSRADVHAGSGPEETDYPRRVTWIVAVVALAAAPLAAEAGAATAPPAAAPTPGTIIHPLPGPQVFPESVAVDAASGRYWATSVKDGTIFTGVVGSAAPATAFSPAAADGRTIATGIAYASGRLAVAGRQTGQAFVYDARSGRLIDRMRTGLPPERTWLNDVAFGAHGAAYFTDSTAPVLWRARRTRGGYRLQRFLDFTGTPVRYRTASGAAGINVNGIAASAAGHDLVIAKRNDNALFHVDLRTKRVRRVALPTGAVTTPDGLVLRGRTLYVVQTTPSAVKVLRLSRDYRTAAVRGTITDPSFAFTTGAAVYRDRLLVVSSQFDTLGSPAAVSGTAPPTLPFRVSEVAAGTP